MARPRSDLFAEIEKMLVRDKRLSKTPPNSIAQIGVCNCGGQIELEINFKNPTVSETNFVGGVLNDGKVRPANFFVDTGRCFCSSCGVSYNAETVCAR